MSNILISETWINRTEGHGIGESGVYETYTDSLGKLYRSLRKEYGRCISKVYIDRDGKAQAIGWVFLKADRYEDTRERFLRETWVNVHTAPTTVSRTPHYASL